MLQLRKSRIKDKWSGMAVVEPFSPPRSISQLSASSSSSFDSKLNPSDPTRAHFKHKLPKFYLERVKREEEAAKAKKASSQAGSPSESEEHKKSSNPSKPNSPEKSTSEIQNRIQNPGGIQNPQLQTFPDRRRAATGEAKNSENQNPQHSDSEDSDIQILEPARRQDPPELIILDSDDSDSESRRRRESSENSKNSKDKESSNSENSKNPRSRQDSENSAISDSEDSKNTEAIRKVWKFGYFDPKTQNSENSDSRRRQDSGNQENGRNFQNPKNVGFRRRQDSGNSSFGRMEDSRRRQNSTENSEFRRRQYSGNSNFEEMDESRRRQNFENSRNSNFKEPQNQGYSNSENYEFRRREDSEFRRREDSEFRRREDLEFRRREDSEFRRREDSEFRRREDSEFRRREDSEFRRRQYPQNENFGKFEDSRDSEFRRRQNPGNSNFENHNSRRRQNSGNSNFENLEDSRDSEFRRRQDWNTGGPQNQKNPNFDSRRRQDSESRQQKTFRHPDYDRRGYESPPPASPSSSYNSNFYDSPFNFHQNLVETLMTSSSTDLLKAGYSQREIMTLDMKQREIEVLQRRLEEFDRQRREDVKPSEVVRIPANGFPLLSQCVFGPDGSLQYRGKYSEFQRHQNLNFEDLEHRQNSESHRRQVSESESWRRPEDAEYPNSEFKKPEFRRRQESGNPKKFEFRIRQDSEIQKSSRDSRGPHHRGNFENSTNSDSRRRQDSESRGFFRSPDSRPAPRVTTSPESPESARNSDDVEVLESGEQQKKIWGYPDGSSIKPRHIFDDSESRRRQEGFFRSPDSSLMTLRSSESPESPGNSDDVVALESGEEPNAKRRRQDSESNKKEKLEEKPRPFFGVCPIQFQEEYDKKVKEHQEKRKRELEREGLHAISSLTRVNIFQHRRRLEAETGCKLRFLSKRHQKCYYNVEIYDAKEPEDVKKAGEILDEFCFEMIREKEADETESFIFNIPEGVRSTLMSSRYKERLVEIKRSTGILAIIDLEREAYRSQHLNLPLHLEGQLEPLQNAKAALDELIVEIQTILGSESVDVQLSGDLTRIILKNGGERIKRIEKASKTWIWIEQNGRSLPEGAEPVAKIQGAPEAVEHAKTLLANELRCSTWSIPQKFCSKLIGHRGENIRRIRAESGATYRLANDAVDGSCDLVIRGSEKEVKWAERMTEECLKRCEEEEEKEKEKEGC